MLKIWTASLNIKESGPSKETSFTIVASAKTVVLTFFIQMQPSNVHSFGVSKLKFVFLQSITSVVLVLGWFLLKYIVLNWSLPLLFTLLFFNPYFTISSSCCYRSFCVLLVNALLESRFRLSDEVLFLLEFSGCKKHRGINEALCIVASRLQPFPQPFPPFAEADFQACNCITDTKKWLFKRL